MNYPNIEHHINYGKSTLRTLDSNIELHRIYIIIYSSFYFCLIETQNSSPPF